MNKRNHRILRRDKRNLDKRLERRQYADQPKPMFQGGKIVYEMAERVRAIGYGGIGAIHTLVRRLKLDHGINEGVDLLKFHVPYHESRAPDIPPRKTVRFLVRAGAGRPQTGAVVWSRGRWLLSC